MWAGMSYSVVHQLGQFRPLRAELVGDSAPMGMGGWRSVSLSHGLCSTPRALPLHTTDRDMTKLRNRAYWSAPTPIGDEGCLHSCEGLLKAAQPMGLRA